MTFSYSYRFSSQKEEFTIYPYVLDFSNSWNYENQLKPVKFPDVDPSSAFDSQVLLSLPIFLFQSPEFQRTNTFSMCAGDFLQAYADTHSQFDSVVSVFFIDTGPNPLQYIRLAHQILKSSGVWLNFGPLTYHHEDSDEPSLELPFSVILQLVEQCGFKVELVLGQGQHPPSLYTCNPNSMLQYNYHCGYFVARKI
jgi:carnosine N-methyltransferase